MKYYPPYGSSDPLAAYVDRNTAAAVRGSAMPADFPNWVMAELVNVISSAGIVPANALQVAAAIQNGRMNFAVAGGTANALTAALSPTVMALSTGLPVSIVVAATNTGPATLNVDSLGAKSILRMGGGPLDAGDLQAGSIMRVIYDGAAFRVVGPTAGELATSQEIATLSQAIAGILNDVLMTPRRTAEVLAARVLGVDQTWQTVVRTPGTVYQNTTGRAIACAGEAAWQRWGGFAVSADNVTWINILDSNEDDHSVPFFCIVPPGHYYKVFSGPVQYVELR